MTSEKWPIKVCSPSHQKFVVVVDASATISSLLSSISSVYQANYQNVSLSSSLSIRTSSSSVLDPDNIVEKTLSRGEVVYLLENTTKKITTKKVNIEKKEVNGKKKITKKEESQEEEKEKEKEEKEKEEGAEDEGDTRSETISDDDIKENGKAEPKKQENNNSQRGTKTNGFLFNKPAKSQRSVQNGKNSKSPNQKGKNNNNIKNKHINTKSPNKNNHRVHFTLPVVKQDESKKNEQKLVQNDKKQTEEKKSTNEEKKETKKTEEKSETKTVVDKPKTQPTSDKSTLPKQETENKKRPAESSLEPVDAKKPKPSYLSSRPGLSALSKLTPSKATSVTLPVAGPASSSSFSSAFASLAKNPFSLNTSISFPSSPLTTPLTTAALFPKSNTTSK